MYLCVALLIKVLFYIIITILLTHVQIGRKNILTLENIYSKEARPLCVQFVIPRQNLCIVVKVGQPPINKEEVLHDETADFPVDGTDSPVLVVRS